MVFRVVYIYANMYVHNWLKTVQQLWKSIYRYLYTWVSAGKSLISPRLEGTKYVVEFIVLGSNHTSAGGDGVKRSMCKVKLAMRRTF